MNNTLNKLSLITFILLIITVLLSFYSYAGKIYLNDVNLYTIQPASPQLFNLTANLTLEDNINHAFEGKVDTFFFEYNVQYVSNSGGLLLHLLFRGRSGFIDEITNISCTDGTLSVPSIFTGVDASTEFDNFHNFSVVFDASNTAEIFIDGQLKASTSTCTDFNNISNINFTSPQSATVKNNLVTADDPINVTILSPAEGYLFDSDSDVNITVNAVVSEGSIHSVLANVSWSDRHFVLPLSNISGSIYYGNFINTTLGGIYNITILASDTDGNSNNNVKTFFNIASGAFIGTDSTIYSPDAVITITGVRFTENINVTLNIVNATGFSVPGFPVNITTNQYGSFQDTATAPPAIGIYTIFANDTTNSIITANTTFEVKEAEGITFYVLNAIGNNLDVEIKIFKKDGTSNQTCNSPCTYTFNFTGYRDIEITPNQTNFSIKKLTIKNFNNPDRLNYTIYLDDPLENTPTPINVRSWIQVSAFGVDFSNYDNAEAKIEHDGGTGLYQCMGWDMPNANCSGYWIRHQTVNDLLENFTLSLSQSFIVENISLAFADSIISIQRLFPKFVAPRQEYNFGIELYNQMDVALTALNLTEVITTDWFLPARAGKVKEVFDGTWSQNVKTAYFELGDIPSRETQFATYRIKSTKLLKNEAEAAFFPFNGTIKYEHVLTEKVVTSLGEITVKNTASPFFNISPSRVDASVGYNYSLKMENIGNRLFSGNISIKIPSLCTINSVDDGSNASNIITWADQNNVLPDTFKTFNFSMSCGYWNNLVLEASAVGNDDDFNTIDVTQNIFVVVDDNQVPSINSVTINPNSTAINNTVNITADVTDDLEIREVKAQIESPNSSVINYTMALFSGNNYVLNFNATYDNGTYSVKIYAIDKSFGINESSNYTFSVIKVNNIPSVSNIMLNNTDFLNRTNGTLVVGWTYSDGENDPQQGNETLWYINGTENEAFRNLIVINSTNTTKNQNWSFSVRVFDGTNFSSFEFSSNMTIENAPPIFDGSIFNQTWDEETLIYINISGNFSDLDSDSLNYNFTPIMSIEVSINNETGIVTLNPVTDFFGDSNIVFYASDGIATATSNNVTLTVNDVAEPVVSSPSSSPSSGGGGGGQSGWQCNYKVECTGWSECIGGKQTRTCKNVKVAQFYSETKCSNLNDSETQRECIKSVPDTCSDNIKNYDEEGIDCGGSCGPCFTIKTKDKEEGSKPEAITPTGAVVGVQFGTGKKYGWLVTLAVILLGLFFYFKFIKKPQKLNLSKTDEEIG